MVRITLVVITWYLICWKGVSFRMVTKNMQNRCNFLINNNKIRFLSRVDLVPTRGRFQKATHFSKGQKLPQNLNNTKVWENEINWRKYVSFCSKFVVDFGLHYRICLLQKLFCFFIPIWLFFRTLGNQNMRNFI